MIRLCCGLSEEDPQIADDLLDVYCPLLGAFAIKAFGDPFVRKVCSTFRDDVAEVIWELQELKGPRHETEFFDWHGHLNIISDIIRAEFLARASLLLLHHESVPPLDVMRVFCPTVNSPARPGMSAGEYLRDLAYFCENGVTMKLVSKFWCPEKNRTR